VRGLVQRKTIGTLATLSCLEIQTVKITNEHAARRVKMKNFKNAVKYQTDIVCLTWICLKFSLMSFL